MKSFSQFLQESYLYEDDAQQLRLMKRDNQSTYNFQKNPGNRGIAADPTPTPASKRLPAGATSDAPKTSPGQLELPLDGQKSGTTPVKPPGTPPTPTQATAGQARQGSLLTKSGQAQNFTGGRTPFVRSEPVNATKRLPVAPPEAPKTSPGQQVIRQVSNPPTTKALPPGQQGGALAKTTSSTLAKTPEIKPVNVRDVTQKPKALPAGKPPSGPSPSALRSAANTADKAATVASNAPKVGKFGKIGRFAGPASAALDTALSTADERAKGSGWARSLAKGATVAAGGLLGGTAGAIGGGGLLSAATGTAGAMAGGAAAEKAFDVAAGANAAQRRAMATANRQRQAGSALKGIGGPTSFDTKKGTMTTGVGPQRKTVQLGKTSVISGPGGKQDVGYLAYKGGQAVYKKAQSPQSLAQTSSNPFERIGRSLLPGAYKASDVAAQQQKLQKAAQSDAARQKALGVKFKPGG